MTYWYKSESWEYHYHTKNELVLRLNSDPNVVAVVYISSTNYSRRRKPSGEYFPASIYNGMLYVRNSPLQKLVEMDSVFIKRLLAHLYKNKFHVQRSGLSKIK